MNVRKHLSLVILITAGASIVCLAQSPPPSASPAPDSSFEELPELKASDILKPEILKGPYHTVREPVPTSSGANQFVIDSEFGVFDADGNEMLLRRVKEVYAIAQLQDVSRTDQFKNALFTAAKGPYNAAKNIVKDPVTAVSNVPKGIMKFMGRAGETMKHARKGELEKDSDGNTAQNLIGYTRAKRKIAVDMGIDPYSSNAVLQKQLGDVAWATWAGGFTFSAATLPIGGGLGTALTVTDVTASLNKVVQEKPPTDLKAMNRSELQKMGAGEKDRDQFLNNTAFSPTLQTAFVLNLDSLDGVANRSAFVRTAAEKSSTESDALFCTETASLMSQIHKTDKPLARIAMIESFPVCIAKDGTVVVAVQWDYAAWTFGAARFADEIQKLATESGRKKPLMIAISGQMSPRLHQELQNRGFTVKDRISPGPLK